MTGMSAPKKVCLLALLVFLPCAFGPWAFGQSRGDRFGPITSALRARDFDKALQLLQPALQQSAKSPQLWTLQGIAFSGKEREKEALACFAAPKISPTASCWKAQPNWNTGPGTLPQFRSCNVYFS
jgi:hypothetical protein